MFSSVLITTDTSAASTRLVRYAAQLRAWGSRRAVLVYAVHVRPVPGLYESVRDLAMPTLRMQTELLRGAGFEVELEIPQGHPPTEIMRVAREKQCDVIVTASRSESLMEGLFLGSMAHAILQASRLPVLLIRMERLNEEGRLECPIGFVNLFEHVLHPTDFSDVAERAFLYLERAVEQTHSAVTLLHVQAPAADEEQNELDRERLGRLRDALEKHGARQVSIELARGAPAAELVERLRRGDCTLVWMGTQGRGYLEEIFIGSVAHELARHALVPVLYVPARVGVTKPGG
ncbi:MAG: universal stress protein [Verrucomicrobiae bacterium]|nr:universal stress protein [Verrucomicrobiae bacterium]